MKVCVLYSSNEVSSEGVPAPARAPIELAAYGPRHEYAYHELTKATAVRDVQQLADRDFDVFLNLCDGAWTKLAPASRWSEPSSASSWLSPAPVAPSTSPRARR